MFQKKNGIERIKSDAFIYVEQMKISRERGHVVTAAQNRRRFEENVIVYVSVMMILRITHFPQRITQDG